MQPSRVRRLFSALAVLALTAPAARASFHFMQIEQVTGGVCGDATVQAIQLRMRLGGQNLVNNRKLIAWNASGGVPVTLITLPGNVASATAGSRILIASAAFAAANGPVPDFTMTNPIPESYLAAGRLTFEDGFGTVYWSLSWGGSSYTGSTLGSTTNDVDGNFGPSFGESLPALHNRAVQFQGTAASVSTNNAADYALTFGGATFINNAGASGVVTASCSIFADGFESGDTLAWSSSVP